MESFDITKKPDIIELFAQRQISELQQSICETLLTMTDVRVTQEVLIHNDRFPSYPFRIDIVLGEPNANQLAVEIDGYHHNKPENIARDQRKTAKMEEMGYTVVRIPYSIPKELVYNQLEGSKRKETKEAYRQWREQWIIDVSNYIIYSYNICTQI